MYALRRNLFPSAVMAPLVDDISVGLQVKEVGGRFHYMPEAVVHVLASTSYLEWVRSKVRTYRAVASLHRLRPSEIDGLEDAFRCCLARASTAHHWSWLLRSQLRVIHAGARWSVRLWNHPAVAWKPAHSTKQWTSTVIDGQAVKRVASGQTRPPQVRALSSCAARALRRPECSRR